MSNQLRTGTESHASRRSHSLHSQWMGILPISSLLHSAHHKSIQPVLMCSRLTHAPCVGGRVPRCIKRHAKSESLFCAKLPHAASAITQRCIQSDDKQCTSQSATGESKYLRRSRMRLACALDSLGSQLNHNLKDKGQVHNSRTSAILLSTAWVSITLTSFLCLQINCCSLKSW